MNTNNACDEINFLYEINHTKNASNTEPITKDWIKKNLGEGDCVDEIAGEARKTNKAKKSKKTKTVKAKKTRKAKKAKKTKTVKKAKKDKK